MQSISITSCKRKTLDLSANCKLSFVVGGVLLLLFDAYLVTVVDTLHDLGKDSASFMLLQPLLFPHVVEQLSVGKVFHGQHKVRFGLET